MKGVRFIQIISVVFVLLTVSYFLLSPVIRTIKCNNGIEFSLYLNNKVISGDVISDSDLSRLLHIVDNGCLISKSNSIILLGRLKLKKSYDTIFTDEQYNSLISNFLDDENQSIRCAAISSVTISNLYSNQNLRKISKISISKSTNRDGMLANDFLQSIGKRNNELP